MMLKGLNLNVDKRNYGSLIELSKFVDTQERNTAWHEMIERRHGMVMATAMKTAEQRKEAKEEENV